MEGKTNGISITVKKGLSILIILLVFMSSIVGSASANEFTLHSGVAFGMTTEQVIQLEQKAGFEVETSEDDPNILKIQGKIASVESSRIKYQFANNKLYYARYDLGSDQINRGFEGYKKIQESLESKYGKPTGLPDGFHSSGYNDILSSIASDGFLQDQGEVETSDEWLITTNTGYIVIEHLKFFYKFTDAFLTAGMNKSYPEGRTYNEAIVYQFYELDDPLITNAINNSIENANQLENDL